MTCALVAKRFAQQSLILKCFYAVHTCISFFDLSPLLSSLGNPKVTVTPANITTQEGCTALFTCLDNNDPPRNFTWFFGDETKRPLVNSSETLIRPNGDLILLNTSGSDTGLYTCQLDDASGPNTFRNATLFVIEIERNVTG